MKQKVAAKTNLISLLDNTYPGVNKLFDSSTRDDGSEKWVDYAYSFWHVDCVRKIGLKAFTERYEAFCKKHHYNYQKNKPALLFEESKQLVAVFPKEKSYKLLIQQSIQQLRLASEHIEIIRREMNELASTPVNEPVYQFLDRKRAEGKPYLVYMTAGANKFLRIYYGKVKECLRNLEQSQIEES